MCGRFVGYRKLEQLKQHFRIGRAECEVPVSYNVAPAQQVLCIIRDGEINVLTQLHWGLVPFWAKDISIGHKLINARMETVASKPAFREAFKARRCLIPADGFYEWKSIRGKKYPVYITLPAQHPFAFAGLWESWRDRRFSNRPPYRTCAIITREASPCIRSIHSRMPLVLRPEGYDTWLDPQVQDSDRLNYILHFCAVTDFIFHPVSMRVNSARHNDPSNIRPVQTEFDF